MIHHFRHNGGPGKIGSADFAFSAADHQHLVQGNFASGLNRKLFHNYFRTFFDAVLFSAGLDNRVHINLQKEKGIFAPQADKCQARFAEIFAKLATTVRDLREWREYTTSWQGAMPFCTQPRAVLPLPLPAALAQPQACCYLWGA